MLTIPEPIKALLHADSVRKNFRVKFPNGERADITNADIVAGSVAFTESVCSRDSFRFGLAEASVIKFETVGVGRIRGATIKCFCEIDTSSLSAAQISAIQADPGDGSIVLQNASDLDYGFYRIPYGVFIVDSCPRNQEAISHRNVTAFSPGYYSRPNVVEQAKLECPIPHAGWTYQPLIAPLVMSQLCYQSDAPLVAAGWTSTNWTMTATGGYRSGIKVRVTDTNGHDLDIYVSYIYKWRPTDTTNGQIFTFDYTKSCYRKLLEQVDDYLETLDVAYGTAVVAGSVSVPCPDVQTLRFLISRQVQTYNGTKYTGASGMESWDALLPYVAFKEDRYGGDPYTTVKYVPIDIDTADAGHIAYYPYGITSDPDPNLLTPGSAAVYVYMPDKVIITVDDITAGTSTDSGFISKPYDPVAVKYWTPPAGYPLEGVHVTYEANGDVRGVSNFSGQVDLARIINDYLELCGWLSSPARDGDARLAHLSNASPVPYSPSDYSGFWFDEDSGLEIGTVRYTAKIGDDRVVADYQFGNGEGVYDMTSNSIFEAIGYSPAQVNAFLQTYFVPYLQGLVLNGIEMEAIGLPHVEAGDCIEVSDGLTTVDAYVTRRELKGEQLLLDDLEAVGASDGAGTSPSSGGGGSGGDVPSNIVTSINGQTGDVSLSAPDVGAMSKWDLLWTNASPNSSFAAQTIPLDLTNYDAVMIVAKYSTASSAEFNWFFYKGQRAFLWSFVEIKYTLRLDDAPVSNSGIPIGDAASYNYGSWYNSITNNSYLVPYKVYGIKGAVNA